MDSQNQPASEVSQRNKSAKPSEKSEPRTVTLAQLNACTGLECGASKSPSKMGESAYQISSFNDQIKSVLGISSAVQELVLRPTDSSEPFPLMKLPAELRLIIFEYAMGHGQDLFWRWKSAEPGKLVGYFVTKRLVQGAGYFDPPATNEKAGYNIITRLHVSRQLRAETLHLWEKFAVLHFDGQDQGLEPPTNLRSSRDRNAVSRSFLIVDMRSR